MPKFKYWIPAIATILAVVIAGVIQYHGTQAAIKSQEEKERLSEMVADLFEPTPSLVNNQAEDKPLCASIAYGGRCGWRKRGQQAFVQNERMDTRVRATVETRWRRGNEAGEEQKEHLVPAGGQRYVACSLSAAVYSTSSYLRSSRMCSGFAVEEKLI